MKWAPRSHGPVRSLHERIAVVGCGHEGLLDRARRDPALQVQYRAGLVIGPAAAGPAERLLPNHGTGRLVVDVEVACRESQHVQSLDDGRAILGDDGTSQPVRPNRGRLTQQRFVVGVVVDENTQDRAEVLGSKDLMLRVVGHDHGRAHEVPGGVVGHSTGRDLDAFLAADPVDDRAELGERPVVDDGTHEVVEVCHVTHRERVHLADQVVAHPRPQRPRDVGA